MNINELPTEMLMEIFSYLPSLSNISLVNIRFYSIACRMSDPEVCLELDEILFTKKEKRAVLRSIQKTSRKITKIGVFFSTLPDKKTFELMVSIIEQFSDTLKNFSYYGELEYLDFLQILSLIPKVVHLSFESVHTPTNQSRQKRRRIMSNIEDLNLHKLKTLDVGDCSEELVILFNRLPAGVLTKLKLNYCHLNRLKVLFTRQINIKTLQVYRFDCNAKMYSVAANLFDNQKLESLVWKSYLGKIQNFLCKQSNLKSLELFDVTSSYDGEKLMNVIVDHLTKLETFSIFLERVPVDAFKKIKELKNLRDLTLLAAGDDNVTYIEEFCKLDNSKITSLNIRYRHNMSDSLIAALARSVPNLKILRFDCDYIYTNRSAIMKIFNFVEKLHFYSFDKRFHSEYNIQDDAYLLENNCTNTNLIELTIHYPLPYKRQFLKKLINDYPNLKKLVISSIEPVNSSQFKLILSGFKKLESFSLESGAYKLNMKDMDCLKQHKNRLKFISLEDMDRIKRTPLVENRLKEIFDVVKFTLFGLQMAVDRRIMKSEEMTKHGWQSFVGC